MKVYKQTGEIPKFRNPVLTMGTFDGVHLGHRKTISQLVQNAQKTGGESVLLSFEPHPRVVLYPENHRLHLIQSLEERIAMLANTGIDHLILYPFTVEFSRMDATDFVREVLIRKIGMKGMTIGYNHQFGRNREGNLSLLRDLANTYDYFIEVADAFEIGGEKVSSTKIRDAVKGGDLEKASAFLGRNFTFLGTVSTGNQIGGQIGFPTVNVMPGAPFQLVPADGVYAVQVNLSKDRFAGMCNIGHRPTVSESGEHRIEIHLFDFDRNVYGANLEIEFIKRVRDEKKFPSRNALQQQLKLDEITCRKILSAPSAARLA